MMLDAAVARMTIEESTDALVRAARDGSREAFSQLIERHRGLVYAYSFARLRDVDEAEDLVQEAFVRAYQSLHRLRGAGAFQPWLMLIARNLCSDRLRRNRIRRTEPLALELPEAGPTPEGRMLSDEARRELVAAVEALPEKFRTPILMRYGSGCTRQEVALALGLPESTVIGRLAGAMRLLRRRLGADAGEEWLR